MQALRRVVGDRLDRYTLRLLAAPLLLSLATLLLAQLLERLLRLFDLASSTGAPLSSVLAMAANLVPHYLGLAVPMAFMAAIFMAVARMGDDNELDVMLATGRSIARVALPYFGVAAALTLFNLYLFGFLQPLGRYGYHVATHEAINSGWNAKIESNRFSDTGQGFVLRASRVDADGQGLHGVFVERDGRDSEEVVTAPRGRLVPSGDGRRLLLNLEDGHIVRISATGEVSTLAFAHGLVNEDFTPAPPPYRPRGDSVRELTFPELWRGMHAGGNTSELAGEFHGRLARALLPPLLPLLALPLGMASKRGRRAPGVVFASLALLAVHHALQFGESLAESGRVAAAPALWTPFVLFTALSLWIFRRSLAWPGDNPVTRAVVAIEGALEGARPRRRKRVQQ
ncbi:MAG: LptF/LptG family permease [Pseudomonadota bacterium]